MTEQQFEKLKTLLDSSHAPDNSTQLDNKILSAAKQNIAQPTHNRVQESSKSNLRISSVSWFARFFQTGLIQSAVLSVTLTLALFFVLGQILKTDPEKSYVKKPVSEYEHSSQALSEIQFATQEESVAANLDTPITVVNTPLPEPDFSDPRDQILAQMSVPDIQALLNDMNFNQQSDRQFAQSLISLAMSDIQFMLEVGNLDNARQRYAQLKQNCNVCTLPNTLEELALEYQKRTENS